MFGFIFGSLCLLGLFGMARHVAWHHGHGGSGHGCGGRHGWRRHRRMHGEAFGRAAAEVIKRRLRVDEDQEIVIDHAMKDARAVLEELGAELKDSRKGLADAFRGDPVDDGALAAAFSRHDDAVARARRQVASAMKQVHAVLDADQRKLAADWLEKGGGGWWS